MKNKWYGLTVAIGIAWCSYAFTLDHKVWHKVLSEINEADIHCVAIDPHDNQRVYIGTSRAVYRSMDYGRHYEAVLELQGSGKGINAIYINVLNSENIFAATDDGLFSSADNGARWEKIYDSADPQSRRCQSVAINENVIYLGTAKGLFYKSLDSSLWNRFTGELSDKTIYKLSRDNAYLYIATDAELYRLDKEQKAEKVFVTPGREVDNLESSLPETQPNEPIWESRIKDISVTEDVEPYIYLATDAGIFCSTDHGENWDKLFRDGLPVEHLTSITIFPKKDTSHGAVISEQPVEHEKPTVEKDCEKNSRGFEIIAGTRRGVYQQKDQGWAALYKGMETNNIQALSTDSEGNVYAATDRGVFQMSDRSAADNRNSDNFETVRQNYGQDFKHEPSIRDVQKWAIHYAEVSPEKIKKWRAAASRKAILPNFSVGLNRGAGELLHWDSGPNPDNLLKGRDYMDWSASLSWNLGDLIWNSDQTSIDSRSKLMVELREDVLDQVTRLYFERRRVQTELASVNHEVTSDTTDREMRVQELTALIDALTGGKFSDQLAKEE